MRKLISRFDRKESKKPPQKSLYESVLDFEKDESNFKQITNLIEKLQRNIDASIKRALDEITQGKNVKENHALITQHRIHESNLRRLVVYTSPMLQIKNLVGTGLRALAMLELIDKEDYDPVLLSRALHILTYDNLEIKEKAIPDADLVPLLLNGKFLPFYDALADLYQSILNAALISAKFFVDPDPTALEKEAYVQNAHELFNAVCTIEARFREKGLDILKLLELEDTKKEISKLLDSDEFPKVIGTLEIKSDAARIMNAVLNGSMTIVANKFLLALDELQNYNKLTRPLYKPIKELKQEVTLTAPKVEETKTESKQEAKPSASVVTLFREQPKPKPAKPKGVFESAESFIKDLKRKFS